MASIHSKIQDLVKAKLETILPSVQVVYDMVAAYESMVSASGGMRAYLRYETSQALPESDQDTGLIETEDVLVLQLVAPVTATGDAARAAQLDGYIEKVDSVIQMLQRCILTGTDGECLVTATDYANGGELYYQDALLDDNIFLTWLEINVSYWVEP